MTIPTRCRAVLLALLALLPLALPLQAGEWSRETLVEGALFKGIHGLGFGPDGMIYVGSVMGQSMYRVDPASGASTVFIGPPAGLADDVEFAPDGTLYWTGFMNGNMNVLRPGGKPDVIARGLPGLNSLALDAKGRLFGTQVFAGDALWEFDPQGAKPPRLVLKDLGGLNGFDFGPDGRLCGPLWFKGRVVCIDVDSGAIDTVAEGFTVPAAANFDATGTLFAIDNATGEIFRIDTAKRSRTRVAIAPSNLDNLAFSADGRLFVTNMADNAIYEVPLDGKPVRRVVGSPLTLPGGLAFAGGVLYVADAFTVSRVDPATGEVADFTRDLADTGFPTQIAANATRLATVSFESGATQFWDLGAHAIIGRFGGIRQPTAVAVLDADRLVVAQADGTLLELDRRTPAAPRVLARDLAQPMGLLRGAAGWYLTERAAGRVSFVGDDGSRRVIASGLQQPEGIAQAGDGRLAVADTGARAVLLIEAADGAIERIAGDLPLGGLELPGYPPGVFPTGLAAGSDGSIFLSSERDGSILRLRPPARE